MHAGFATCRTQKISETAYGMRNALQILHVVLPVSLAACSATPMPISLQGAASAAAASSANSNEKPIVTATQLVGLWQTANVNKPFDMNDPKLTLRFTADGGLVTDESTNREARGTWRLQEDRVITEFANSRYANRILRFDGVRHLMVLQYEMYESRSMNLQRVE